MQKYCVVKNGIVVNVILWDGNDSEFASSIDGDLIEKPTDVNVGIGWSYDGANFNDTNITIPKTNAELFILELDDLNLKYASDISQLSTAWGNAGLFDGSTEIAKKTQLQAQASSLKSSHLADIAALKIKYGI